MIRTCAALMLALVARAEPAPRLERAIELPAVAQRLRDQGVPAAEVTLAVRSAKDHGLPASEATDVLEEGAKGEKLDNFGKFVKGQLDAGLRGRELAQAIHEEQAKRGKGGKGPDGEGPPGLDGEKGGKGKAPDGQEGKVGKGKAPDQPAGGEGKAGKGKGPAGGEGKAGKGSKGGN